jgi:hypothetical protein
MAMGMINTQADDQGGKQNNGGQPWYYQNDVTNSQNADFDADKYHASLLARYLGGEGGLKGDVEAYAGDLNTDVARSAMNNLLARAGQRKELKTQLSALPGQQQDEENMLTREATTAMGEGLKKTRQNYNQRGLLYGGMREGGESQVRSQTASALSSNLSGVRRDYQNEADAKKTAIAQLGLAAQKEALERASMVQEQTMKNSVARMQAYQQLGQGVGYAGARAYSAYSSSGSNYDNMNPNNNNYQRLASGNSYLGDASNQDMFAEGNS